MCLILYLGYRHNIPPLTKNVIGKLATNIPEMAEVTVHTTSNKLQEIYRNYLSHLLLSVKSKAFWTDKEFGAGQYSIKRKALNQH